MEAQITVKVAEEILAGRIAYALVDTGDLDLLRHHVDDQVGGDAVALVVPPLEEVAVVEIGDAHGAVVVVYLVALGVDLELADQVAQLAETAGGQHVGRGVVEHGYLVEAYLGHVLGEVAVLDREQAGIVTGAEHAPADDRADDGHKRAQADYIKRYRRLLPCGGDVLLHRAAAEAAEDELRGAPDQRYENDENIQVAGVYVQRGELEVEVQQGKHYGDHKAYHRGLAFGQGAPRLLGLASVLLRRGPAVFAAVTVLVKAAEVAKVKFHRVFVLQRYFETPARESPCASANWV